MSVHAGIIGAGGFIGRNLSKRLARDKDVRVTCFGRGSAPAGGPHVKPIDLSNPASVAAAMEGVDIVYYLASETIPATSWERPLTEIEGNLTPFIRFAEACAGGSLKKIVFLSSAGTIYGPSTQKISESSDKHPFSPYGITKLAMEHFLNYFQERFGIRHDVFRVSNVYGEGQDTSKGLGLINTLIERIVSEGKVTLYGDGRNSRNFVYIGDVAELLALSLRRPFDASGVYNLASNDTYAVRDVVKLIGEVTGERFAVEHAPARQSDNSFIDLDNSKILEAFRPFRFTDIRTGIASTYSHIKESYTKSRRTT